MKQCGTCEHFTLKFPPKERFYNWDYFREAGIGRCTNEPASKVRSPVVPACDGYKEAENMDKRIQWMEARK